MKNIYKKYIKFDFFKNIYKIFFNEYKESIPLLGRWCHVNVPNCNSNIILKKIDFANNDNNLSYKNNKKVVNTSLTPQEYIDGFNN
tara:strand:- start:496 stop:753 length:258 start_codon:yes stop_codon:yes gene_type:complete